MESLLAAVVLAISVLGVSGMIAASYQQTVNLNESVIAVALGRQLLDEIASKPLANPSGGSTTPVSSAAAGSRSAFTYAGQYNLYTDNGDNLSTLGGSTVNATGGTSYKRSVTVALGAKPSGDTLSPTTDFALATVTVTTPSGQTVTLSRVLSNYTFTR